MIPHIMIVQSAYTDAQLSKRRLEICKHTCANSLWFQVQKPIVHVAVNPADPHLKEREEVFRSTGCEVKFLYRDSWKLYKENWELPEGRKIVSRMDDDDVISKDFCLLTRNAAPAEGEMNLIWPNGYVYWRETPFLLNHKGIQFVTLVTDHIKDPHQEHHSGYHKTWPTRVVSKAPGWIWIRHGDSASSTLPRYRNKPVKGIDSKRIPVNLRAVLRAIADSGKASGNYVEHKQAAILKHVLKENANNGMIKDRFLVVVPTHRYKLAEQTIKTLEKTLTYPTDFHVLDGTSGKMHALNKALDELLDEKKHTIYSTVDDDVILPENWQHSIACALDRVPRLGICGIDMAGTPEGEAYMAAAMSVQPRQHKDVLFRDTTGTQNVAGASMSMRPALAKAIGKYPFADDGRRYQCDEDGWRCHQAAKIGYRYGYAANSNGVMQFLVYEDSKEYIETKQKDLQTWKEAPAW